MTACEERYFGGEQNVSTNKSTFTTIYNQEILAGNDSANCPLCCSLLFPFQQACLTLRLLHVVLVVQVVFPMSARRLSSDWQLFQKMLPQKLFFVVSLSAGMSDSQVPFHGTLSRHGKTRASSVLRMTYRKRCYTLYLLFKLFSLYQLEDPARSRSIKY